MEDFSITIGNNSFGLFLNAIRQTKVEDKNGSFSTFIVQSFCCCDCVADEKISKIKTSQLESNTTVDYSTDASIFHKQHCQQQQ